MKRALMYASVASMIQQFNMENIRLLLKLGYEVDVVCNMEQGNTISADRIAEMKQELECMGVRIIHMPIPRKISSVANILRSIFESRKLMNNRLYDLIHCHSPIGGMTCRLANRFSHNYQRVKMIYTAHGFHFFKGNHPLKNVLFRTIEVILTRFTDVLITINQEDYNAAKSFRLKKGGTVKYVPGVGIDLDRIDKFTQNRKEICRSLGIPTDSVMVLSVGELNDNKNHRTVVEKLDQLPVNYHYLICGQGANRSILEDIARKHGCGKRLHILGYREDVISIMKSCDLFVFPSKREGLSVALMEAMACGMPCFASNIRGNCDLITQDAGGMLFPVESFGEEFVVYINNIENLLLFCETSSLKNERVIKNFSRKVVEKQMEALYA